MSGAPGIFVQLLRGFGNERARGRGGERATYHPGFGNGDVFFDAYVCGGSSFVC
jgi:hypothetical protein